MEWGDWVDGGAVNGQDLYLGRDVPSLYASLTWVDAQCRGDAERIEGNGVVNEQDLYLGNEMCHHYLHCH